MSCDTCQTFEHSVELLNEIFPDENWVWFLSKNLHGFTDGFATIPFFNDSYDILYKLGDLADFAFDYGRGHISPEEIAEIIYGGMSDDDLDDGLDELLGGLESRPATSGSSENHFLLKAKQKFAGWLHSFLN